MASNTTVIEIVTTVEDKTKAGAASAASTVSKLEKAMKKAQGEIEKIQKMSKIELTMYAVDKASKVLNGVWNTGKKLTGKVWKVTLKAVDLVTAPFRGIMKTLTNPVVALAGIAGVSLGIGDLIGTYKDFEQGMANVRAISGATKEDLTALTETAKKLGEETMFSAKQVSGAMEFLAMAGWKKKDITDGLPNILNLASAGNVEIATAADIASSAIAQFNMEAKEASRVADVLAATATNSKTDVTGLGESLKFAGSMAGALKYSIEDVTLGLGLMGNRGIDGSMAGTAMRSLISRMAKEGQLTGKEKEEVAGAMNKLGVSLYDKKGKTRPLIEIFKQMRAGFKKLRQDEKSEVAYNLAGMYGQAGFLAIVETSEEKFNSLAKAIKESEGAAAKMSKIRMDTLQGSMLYLQSAAEGVKLAFMEKLAPYLKEFIDWLTSKMPDLKDAAVDFAESISNTIDNVKASVTDMFNSEEWKNAETFWDKVKVAWNKLIAEPFDEWWSGTGKAWLADKAKSIGEGLGKAVTFGFTALFGGDTDGIVQDGVSIGASFGEGFSKGFDGAKVAEAIKNAVSSALKLVFSNPVTGGLATAWIGGKLLGGISGMYSLGKTAKGLWGSLFGSGMNIAVAGTAGSAGTTAGSMAAGVGTVAANTAVASVPVTGGGLFASIKNNGLVNTLAAKGIQAGSNASSVGGLALRGTASVMAPVAAVTGGIYAGTTLISAGRDFIKAIKSNNKEEKAIYKKSAAWKTGGTATGAIIGTMILPGLGTAIGAGIGALAGNSVSDIIKADYEEKLEQEEEEKRQKAIKKGQEKFNSKELKQGVAKLVNGEISQEELDNLVRNTVLNNLKNSFGNVEYTLSEIQSIAKKITFGNAAESLSSFASATEEAANSLAVFEKSSQSLKKINWKASLGLDWTQADNDEFVQISKDYVSSAKDLLTDKQYEMTMAVKLLFQGGDKGGDEIVKSVDDTYAGLQKQVDGLMKENDAIYAKNSGKILSDKDKARVDQNTEKISEIMNSVADAENKAGLNLLGVKYADEDMNLRTFQTLQQELFNYQQEGLANYDQAFKLGATALEQRKSNDKNYTDEAYTADYQKLEEQYKQKSNELVQKILDFQIPKIAAALENTNGVDTSKIFPDLEGDLKERLKTGLFSALQTLDFDKWDNNTWLTLFGNNEENAKAAETLLTPVAQSITEGFLRDFGPSSEEAAKNMYETFGNDLSNMFSNELRIGARVVINYETLTYYARSKLMGEEINTDKIKEGVTVTYSTDGFEKIREAGGEQFLTATQTGGGEQEENFIGPKMPNRAYAEGGILTKPHIGLVAEDGAEAIIPLSDKRRNRGISLWEKAGKLLGIKPRKNKGIEESIPAHAEGGIFGYVSSNSTKENIFDRAVDNSGENRVASEPVTVNLGGINITINSSEAEGGRDIMEIIRRNMPEISNEVAGTIAKALMNLFANMKAGII